MRSPMLMYLISFWLLVHIPSLQSQQPNASTTEWIDSVLTALENDRTTDIRTKSEVADSVYAVSLHIDDICRQLRARVYQSVCLEFLGQADSSLALLFWAARNFAPPCDSHVLMNVYSSMTNSFLSMEEYGHVDSISQIALRLWNPTWQDNLFRFSILNNMAIAKVFHGDTGGGMLIFQQLYQEARRLADRFNYRKALINMGTIKGMTGELDSAYYFFTLAAEPSMLEEDKVGYLDVLYNLANIDLDRKQYQHAIMRLDTLFSLASTFKHTEMQAATQETRSRLYAATGQYKKAYEYAIDFISLREMTLNEERVRAVTEMNEKYESEKKISQIKDLEVKNLDATLKNERISNTRNRFMYAGAGILLIAIGSLGRLQYVRRAKHAIQKEKDISEGLLLNILPATVAEELKVNGRAKAKSYDLATILFSDFKNFTAISSDMSAEAIVDEINVCFQAFDEIMAAYGLEKIKTIGDAYMAAGAVPDDNKAEAQDVIHAALAMQEFIIARKKIRDEQQQPGFEMRIGIHTGPVVAGIVGVKKFQYDLWGDTVNIASRMETYSEPGYVNISATTYELVKNDPSLTFTPRGMIEVKGKGEMMMYFVSRQQQAVA